MEVSTKQDKQEVLTLVVDWVVALTLRLVATEASILKLKVGALTPMPEVWAGVVSTLVVVVSITRLGLVGKAL